MSSVPVAPRSDAKG